MKRNGTLRGGRRGYGTLMEDTKKLHESVSNSRTQDPILKEPQSLFRKLHSTFQQFLIALSSPHRHSRRRRRGRPPRSPPPHHLRLRSIVENLSLLLRRCLLFLTVPHSDQKFFFLKCRDLLPVLHSFISLDVAQHRSLLFPNFLSDVDLNIFYSSTPFLRVLLEVFADELLRHQSLRRYLMIADSVSSIDEKLFECHFNQGDIASVLEVLSTHFILSVSNTEACEDFTSRLFLHRDKDLSFHELSLASSMMLLLDPVFLSAPKMFQAHIISMASEAISSGLSSTILVSDMNCYLTALQKSVNMYCMHVSSLQIDGFHVELKYSYNSYLLERGEPTFESYIRQSTRNRLSQVLSKSDKSWDSYKCKISSQTKADLLAEYIAFMKERQYIFVDSSRDVTTSILDCIINLAFSQDATGDALYSIKENTSAQDIFLLASILKLMSVSLLLAIKYLSNSGDSDCLKTMGCASVREKYDFLISILDQFQQFKFCLPIQTFLYDDITESLPSNYKLSKSMLVHFIGLLSLSFSNGLDLLAKGCISVLMALIHLFVFEEEDLVAMESLRCLLLQPGLSKIPSDKSQKGTRDKQTFYKVAAEFRRIQACNLRTDSLTASNIVDDGIENGKMFLNCIVEDPKKVFDFDELADFLECKTEKKYSKWLNDRKIYRKWRRLKKIELRNNKKETFLKSSKSKIIGKSLKGLNIFTFMKHWR